MKARSATLHFKTFFFEIYKQGRSMTVNLTEKNNNDHITAKDVCAYMYKLGKSVQSGIDSSIFH